MKKVFFILLLTFVFLGANYVLANDGYYADSFKPSSGHKIRTNPIGQWFDDQVNKSYVQKKNQNVEKKTNTNSYNSGFNGYNNQNRQQKKTAPRKPTSSWSS